MLNEYRYLDITVSARERLQALRNKEPRLASKPRNRFWPLARPRRRTFWRPPGRWRTRLDDFSGIMLPR